MKKHRKAKVVLISILSFLMVLFAVYLQYYPSKTDILSGSMLSENLNDDDSSICQDEFKMFAPPFLLIPSSQRNNHFKEFDFFSYQLTSHSQDKSVLRC
jgi:hypothetical protein